MNRTARALPAALLLLLPAAAGAQAVDDYPPQEKYSIRGEYREFRPDFTGDIQKGFGTDAGTLLDIQDDLGFQDERTFEIRGTIQVKRGHKIRGSYTPLDYSGDVAARRRFTFGTVQVERDDRVVTSMKGAYWAGAYEWDFVKGPKGFVGATLGARFLDMDVTMVAPEESTREQDTLRAPIPVLGLVTRVYAGRLSLEGEFAGFTLGDRGKVIEFDASGRVHISDRLAAGGGYRYVHAKAKNDRDFGDLTLNGWHFGIELSL